MRAPRAGCSPASCSATAASCCMRSARARARVLRLDTLSDNSTASVSAVATEASGRRANAPADAGSSTVLAASAAAIFSAAAWGASPPVCCTSIGVDAPSGSVTSGAIGSAASGSAAEDARRARRSRLALKSSGSAAEDARRARRSRLAIVASVSDAGSSLLMGMSTMEGSSCGAGASSASVLSTVFSIRLVSFPPSILPRASLFKFTK